MQYFFILCFWIASTANAQETVPTIEELQSRYEAGDVAAQVKLVHRYAQAANQYPDKKEQYLSYASSLLQDAAAKQNPEAELMMYLVESEAKANKCAPRNWLENASHHGSADASMLLAQMEFEGTCGTKNEDLSFSYLYKAAEQGNPNAQFLVAEAYLKGKYVQRDMQVAKKWMEKSAGAGYQPAIDAVQLKKSKEVDRSQEGEFDGYGNIIFIAFVILSLITGSISEKRHYASIRKREKNYVHIPIITYNLDNISPDSVAKSEMAYGCTVLGMDRFRSLITSLRSIFGGKIKIAYSFVDRSRRESILKMIEHNPNAAIFCNVRIERMSVSKNQVCYMAYGTAIYHRT